MAKPYSIQYVSFYTEGSVAKKLELKKPAPKATLPKQKKRKCKLIRIDPVALLATAVAVCMLTLMVVGFFGLCDAREKTQLMQSYVDTLTAQNAQLEKTFQENLDLEQVEAMALALGMVPASQVQQVTIAGASPEQPTEQESVWSNLGVLIMNLFA